MRKHDYSNRDKNGKVVFYVPLWKRDGITMETFDDYWSNVHGPVCSRLPGQHQYWQFHVAHDEGGIWPQINGIEYTTPEEEQFDGIAELSFKNDEDRKSWFTAAGILMDDEHNPFKQAIGINTMEDHSITFVDGIENAEPNGSPGLIKLHVMIKQSKNATVDDFRDYLTNNFAKKVIENNNLLKLRLHMFEEVDNTRPPAAGVSHSQPEDQQFQAAMEIAFENRLEMERFFASDEYKSTMELQPKYIRQISVFPERTAFTFIYDDKMTIAGLRGSKVCDIIKNIGATNQLKDDIIKIISKNEPYDIKTGKY